MGPLIAAIALLAGTARAWAEAGTSPPTARAQPAVDTELESATAINRGGAAGLIRAAGQIAVVDLMPRLKIATFNINNVVRRLPVLLRWLREVAPDVVCLQELKAADRDFPMAAIAELGYGARWVGQRSWNGVAILFSWR